MISSVASSQNQQTLPLRSETQQAGFNPTEVSNANISEPTSTMAQVSETNHLADIRVSTYRPDIDLTSVECCINQPVTRPISQEQLVAEVKGIYAGLAMVESKCVEVLSKQNELGDTAPKLNDEQFQALIALHRTLLHEHHDFMLASQHPSASPDLKELAAKYDMPQRMIRHGVIDPINFFGKRDDSKEHYLTMLHTAHGICALLSETVNTEIKEQYVPIRDQLAAHIERAPSNF
jgi:hypothetical protein